MKYKDKTKEELIKELQELQQAYSLNIAQQKHAENMISASLERFDSLLAKVPVGLYVFWRRTNGYMEFEYVSDRLCELLQITHEEAVGEASAGLHGRIHKEDLEDCLAQNEIAARDKKKFVWQGRFVTKSGIRWFHVESIPVAFPNGDIQWYGVLQDITERIEAENALRESEIKLRNLNAQKNKLLSIIAHDLRSPFNSIIGFSNLLIEKIENSEYEEVNAYAGYIEQASKQAMDLLTNLLEWSRSQTDRIVFNPDFFVLDSLIEENKILFNIAAKQKNITINLKLNKGLTVFADKPMISTVLRNLISNAIKFTKAGGEIVIASELKSEEIIISVKDNGVGMSADRLKTIFKIDKNESTLGTNNEKGTGLGLILCKEFIEKHGGKIWVEREINKGSVFYFNLFTNDRQNKAG